MSNPRVSFILPVYNIEEEYLLKSIRSILGQTVTNIEVILIDDGSQGSCGIVCDSFARLDKRVISIHQDNRGVAASRNVGLDHASGEWICFVDPDDWVELTLVEKLLPVLDDTETDLICFDYIEDSLSRSDSHHLGFDKGLLTSDQLNKFRVSVLHKLKVDNNFVNYLSEVLWNKMYKHSYIKEHYIRFVEKLKRGEDRVFNMMLLADVDKIVYVNECLYHYRITDNSTVNAFNPRIIEYGEAAIGTMLNWTWNNQVYDIYANELNVYICNRFYMYLRLYFINDQSTYKAWEVHREIRRMINREPYASAFREVSRESMTKGEQLFIGLLKRKMIYPVMFMAWIKMKG